SYLLPSSAPHPVLHSFPTRRSSDLVRTARAKVNLWLNVVGRRADGYHLLDMLVGFTDLADEVEASTSDSLSLTFDSSATAPGARSEEHTSELQSQSNLVCRLLLEKK